MKSRRDSDINSANEKIVQRGIVIDKLEGRQAALKYLASRHIPTDVVTRVLLQGKRRDHDPR